MNEVTLNNGYKLQESALICKGLTKSYGKVQALRGVDLQVQRGEIYGFLGPNGAGKTTTIRCLLDMIRPNGGEVLVLGLNPQASPIAVQQRCGYLPGEMELFENLTVEQQLKFLSDMRGRKVDWEYTRQLCQRLSLDLKHLIKNLSKGNKQKIGVVQALMHRPELLLLDEPTGGLDPLMQQEVLDLIRDARAAGATVFFSSHILSEVEAVTDRVAIIREGKIIEVGETSLLTQRALHRITVRFMAEVDTRELERLAGVQVLTRTDEKSLTLQVTGVMDGLIKALGAYPISEIETARPSLEDVFLAYYKKENG